VIQAMKGGFAVWKARERHSVAVASVLGVGVLIVCVTAVWAWQNPPQPPRASLNLSNHIRELGHTSIQKEWRVPFQIRNSGTRRLVINETDPDCGCGNRSLRTILVPSGETAELTVTLDTRFAAGPIEAIAAFTTNDPARPRFNLIVRARVDAASLPLNAKPEDTAVSILIRQ
jgi:hypothetical protein